MLPEVKYSLLTAAWLAWCAVHSILIWPTVKNRLQKRLGSACRFYRLGYNLFAALSLAPLAYLTYRWQTEPLLQWQGWGKGLQWLLLIVAVGLFGAGARQYDLLDFAGLRHRQCPSEPTRADRLSTKGVLNIIRHPWYTAAIILIWARDVDLAGLLVNGVLTLYLIVGAYIEEYKLVHLYGDEYRRYRRQVSMFIPLKLLARVKDEEGTMNRILPSVFLLISLLTISCASKQPHHPNPMPDPQAYNAHFHDLDSDGDGRVTWTEFKGVFPHAEEIVFETVDLNQDGGLDHDEWHAFRKAHGLEHH